MHLYEDYECPLRNQYEERQGGGNSLDDGDFELDLNMPYIDDVSKEITRREESERRETIQVEDKPNHNRTKRSAPIQHLPSSKRLKASDPIIPEAFTQLRTLPPPPDPARRLGFRVALPTITTNTTKATDISLPPVQIFSGKRTARREKDETKHILIDLSIEPVENLHKDQQKEHTKVCAQERLCTKMGRRKSHSQVVGINSIDNKKMEHSSIDFFPDVQNKKSPSNNNELEGEEMNEFLESAVFS